MKHKADILKIKHYVSSMSADHLTEVMVQLALDNDSEMTVNSFEIALRSITEKLQSNILLHATKK